MLDIGFNHAYSSGTVNNIDQACSGERRTVLAPDHVLNEFGRTKRIIKDLSMVE